MYGKPYTNMHHTAPPGLDPFRVVLTLVGVLAALVLALPALLLGLVSQRLAQGQPWSTLVWLLLTIASVVLLFALYTHGLDRLVLMQLTALVSRVKLHQGAVAAWDLGQLWSLTWPVWLRTIVGVPIIALWRDLGKERRGGREALLRRQEDYRKLALAQATRRARHPDRVREVVDGHMVIGIPIKDEHIP